MTKRRSACLNFLLILLSMMPSLWLKAQQLPDKKEILSMMGLTNKYFMNKWPDPGKEITTNKTRPSNIWTREVYYEGLMAFYKISPQKTYYDYAVQWGEWHKWGLREGPGTRNADNQCCGQTYIDLYLIDRKPERIKDIKTCMDSMLMSDKIDDWSWVDAIQMAMPIFARLGALYKDNAYYEKMYKLYHFSKTSHGGNGLYNPADHLWWRDKDFVPPYKEPNAGDCYWSRGNGWALAALVRVMDIMPKNAPHYNEYLATYVEMVKAIVPLQRKDGFWNVSLEDSTHFGGKETSGTALFTYGIAWGINKGILSKKTYQPKVVTSWNMVKDAVHADGFLGYLQGTGKEPKDGQPVNFDSKTDFEDYGLGCFLLAGSELYKMK
ncbi:MAG: glycoside hydrolase family 88 protein [Chitinophagaceae bacterium]